MLELSWWKYLCMVLFACIIIIGFTIEVPQKQTLYETIRNYFFHPPLWVCMITLFTISLVNSIKYLRTGKEAYDIIASSYGQSGLLFGLLGILTGMIWARYTWGSFWSGDPKQTGTAIGLLIYAAYIVLRGSIHEEDKRARVSAVYNIFAFFMLIPTLFVLPRMVDSLHPGSKGNPLVNPSDIKPSMFIILWLVALPAYILLGIWLTSISIRYKKLINYQDSKI